MSREIVHMFTTYLCPWNTSWVSSRTFHRRTVRSLPPDDTGRSLIKQSMPVTSSWWPNLSRKLMHSKNASNTILTMSQHKPSHRDSTILLYGRLNSWKVRRYLAETLTPVLNILMHSTIILHHSQSLCYDGPWNSLYVIASLHSKHVPLYPVHR